MHEECAKAWPIIKPIIDLHLATIDGAPMHASANGFYWLAGAAGGLGEQYHGASGSSAKTPEECLSILAEHLRISPETALKLRADAAWAYSRAADTQALPEASERAQGERHKAGSAAAKQVVADFCAAQRERWEQEAKDGLALIRALSEAQQEAAA